MLMWRGDEGSFEASKLWPRGREEGEFKCREAVVLSRCFQLCVVSLLCPYSCKGFPHKDWASVSVGLLLEYAVGA